MTGNQSTEQKKTEFFCSPLYSVIVGVERADGEEKSNINATDIGSNITVSGFVCQTHCLATWSLFYYSCVCGPGLLSLNLGMGSL